MDARRINQGGEAAGQASYRTVATNATLNWQVQAAAQLEHVEDVFALFKRLEERATHQIVCAAFCSDSFRLTCFHACTLQEELREQQDAPPRSAKEIALLRAHEAMDGVVKNRGRWDIVKPVVAQSLEEAGLPDIASIAAS